MNITIGNTVDIITQAQSIRHQVFVIEQNIPQELDLDGLDEESSHALVTNEGVLVATARLSMTDNGCAVMARVAVIKEYRGAGVASNVINALISHARQTEVRAIEIHAHAYLRNYDEHFGFEYVREVEIVGKHPLIEMRKVIIPDTKNGLDDNESLLTE